MLRVEPSLSPAQPSPACFTFSRCTVTVLPSSMSQELSSTLTSLKSSPSMTGGWPLRPTLRRRLWMSTTTSLPFSLKLTLKGTASCTERSRSEEQAREIPPYPPKLSALLSAEPGRAGTLGLFPEVLSEQEVEGRDHKKGRF